MEAPNNSETSIITPMATGACIRKNVLRPTPQQSSQNQSTNSLQPKLNTKAFKKDLSLSKHQIILETQIALLRKIMSILLMANII